MSAATGPDGLRTEIVEDVGALAAVAAEWDALAEANGWALAAPAWLLAWWRNCAPSGARLRVVVVRDAAGAVVGLAPFAALVSGRVTVYRPLGSGMAIRSGPLAAPGHEVPVARAIAAALAGARPRPGEIHLEQVDEDSPWPLLLTRAWPGALPPRRELDHTAPAPTLRLTAASYEEWLAGKSSNFRQRLRRDARKLTERGAVTRLAATPEELEWALGEFDRLHGEKWGDESPLASAAGARMMLEAGRDLLASGRFRVYWIEVEGRAITVQIFVAAGGEVVYWNGGWDTGWSSLTPALQCICSGVEDAFGRGERRVDFGQGEHHYKTRLADGDDPIAWFRISPRGLAYPRTLLLTLPRRAKRVARSALDHAPAPVRARIDRLRGRSGETPAEDDA